MNTKSLITKIAVLLLIIQSCNSQEINLENLTFTENVNQILKKTVYSIDKTNPFFPAMTVFETTDNNLLIYGDVKLLNNTNDVSMQNSILFATEANDSIIRAMLVHAIDKLNSQRILKNLENKFGNGKIITNRIHMLADGGKSGTINYLWENHGITYLLNYEYTKQNEQPLEEVYLFIFKDTFRLKPMLLASFTN